VQPVVVRGARYPKEHGGAVRPVFGPGRWKKRGGGPSFGLEKKQIKIRSDGKKGSKR